MIRRLAFIAFLAFISPVDAADGKIFYASEADWKDAPKYPGAKMVIVEGNPAQAGPFTVRYKLPANTTIPPHFHPSEERDTVISGSLHVIMGEDLSSQVPQTLLPGDFWFIPAQLPHSAYTTEETILQINGMGPWGITYLPCNH